MAKRKTTRRRQRHDPRIPDRAPLNVRAPHSAGLPHAIPIAIPTYWSPEQAIAVFELVDDLRETIWSIYQTHLQDLTRQQRQSPVIGRRKARSFPNARAWGRPHTLTSSSASARWTAGRCSIRSLNAV